MKKLLLKTWLLLMCLLLGVGTSWAEEQTATLTFTAACGGSGTDDKGNSWTITSDASESAYDGTKGIHYGTGKAAVSYLKLTNSSITGTITKIVVNASGASGTSAKIDVKVGGSAFGSQQSLTSSNAAYTFNGSASGNIEISLTQTSATKALYVKSVAVTYSTAADTRTAVNMTGFSATTTTLIKGNTTETTVTNDQNDWTPSYTYKSDNTNVATVSDAGIITAVAKGTAKITASLNIANDDANWKKGATSSKSIDITVNNPSHTAHFSVNGTVDPAKDANVEEGEAIPFPANPEVEDVIFMGWTKNAIDGTKDNAPSDICTSATMGTEDVTYYAVFAVQDGDPAAETKTQTLQYDTWTYSGSTTDKSTYRLFHSGSYIESASFDRSTLSKVVVYGGTFGGDSYNKLTIGDGTNTWKSVTVSGSSQTGENTYTGGTALSGTGSIRVTSNSGSASSNGVRISKVEIYTLEGGYTYSNYCTTVALDPKPTIVLSATELAEYAGNINTSITASVSEVAYTGALSVESSTEAVATASISEGTISIEALTAGSATITVTALAVTGFRKNTATITVTVSEKLAHGLSFNADVLNLTVGDTEITEPTLSNPNSLPVVYSLVYATPANEGKVATIDASTGKLTLADPSLSTETQGAVTVKASTVGDNSHAAGEVTYDLVVARKVTTTSWSNEGAAVNIDKDEIAKLPTASNDAERNLFYESSNTDVATIDGTGAVTFVAYGSTTITAKTTATADYAATSASYELTFAPRYTVTFNINGEETELREETSGAGVTAPAVADLYGKVFRGWAGTEIDGTTDDAPAFVSTASLDGDKTLYAVFATESGSALDYTFTIAKTDLSSSGYSAADGSHNVTAKCTTDPENTLTIAYTTSNVYQNTSTNPSKLQWKKDVGTLYNTTNLGTITNVTVADASSLNTYYGTTEHPTSGSSVGSGNGFFSISAGSSTGTASSITVAFSKGTFTYSDYCTTVTAPSFDVTVSAAGYSTLYLDYAVTIPTGVQAFTGVLDGDKLTMTELSSGVIPAETAVVLKATAANYKFEATTCAPFSGSNDLKGCLTDTPTETIGDGIVCTLAKVDEVVGFYKFTGPTLGANKAYLVVAPETPARVTMSFDDESNAIETVEVENLSNDMFDLMGRRTNNKTGLRIVNGKKVMLME